MAKEIELQNGMKAIVDDEDFERVNQYNWAISKSDTSSANVVGWVDGKLHRLTRFILEENREEILIIRKNKNQLDFQKDNLLVVSQKSSAYARGGQRNKSSKYKGVCWHKKLKKWKSSIGVNGKSVHLGYTTSEEEAALLYNKAARKYFGEHAYQNIIGEDNSTPVLDIPKSKTVNRNPRYERSKNYRGVYLRKHGFVAEISKKYIGFYKNEIDAAKAYNEKAKELFGDKAILNDIPDTKIPTLKDMPKVENPEQWHTRTYHTKSGGAMLKQ